MANWKYTLDFKKFYNDPNTSIKEKAIKACNIIESTFPDPDSDLEDVWYSFESAIDTEDFNSAMEQLYDWADQEIPPRGQWPPNKKCWVKTF